MKADMTRPIVVPLDGLAVAERALAPAAVIANALQSELHLVRVSYAGTHKRGPWLLPYSTRADVARFFVEERAREQAYLDAVANRLRETSGIERIATPLIEGPLPKAIVKYSRRQHARLIVLTTHGLSGIRGVPVGSVADKVARLAGLPVLLIRPDASNVENMELEWRCERIVVLLDGSDLAQKILKPVTMLGLALSAQVILVTALNAGTRIALGYPPVPMGGPLESTDWDSHTAETYLARIAQKLRGKGLMVDTRVVKGDQPAEEAIGGIICDLNADMIAIATRGRGGVMRLAFGSVAGSLMRSNARSLLVLRPMKAE